MASIKSFISISLLTKAHVDDLAELLTPMKGELETLKLWETDDKGKAKFQYSKLAYYLHENCDSIVEDRLYAFHSIAKPELYEAIVSQLDSLGIPTLPTDDVYAIAAKLVLKSIKRCNFIASRRLAVEQHTYEHFRPQVFARVDPLSPKQITHLKKNLSSYFESCGKSKYIEIYVHLMGKYAFYCVSHGAPKTRENSVDEQKVHTFRPELVDIIRVNLLNGEISIFTKKCSAKILKRNYCKIFGAEFMPDAKYEINAKYNLNNLCNSNSLSIGELSNEIAHVEVGAFTYKDDNGCVKDCRNNVSKEVFSCMERNVEILSITFLFSFRNTASKFRVKLSGANRSEFPNGCDEELVDKFFIQNGFSIDNSDEKLSEMVQAKQVAPVQ